MLRPIGRRVLVRPEPQPKETESGLALVQDWKPEVTGTIERVADGPLCQCPECGAKIDLEPEVRVGDYIVFSWQDGQEVFVDGDRFLILHESEIKAVVDDKE